MCWSLFVPVFWRISLVMFLTLPLLSPVAFGTLTRCKYILRTWYEVRGMFFLSGSCCRILANPRPPSARARARAPVLFHPRNIQDLGDALGGTSVTDMTWDASGRGAVIGTAGKDGGDGGGGGIWHLRLPPPSESSSPQERVGEPTLARLWPGGNPRTSLT